MGKRRKVTTRDIAKYAELSQSTVSMILSDKKNVSFSQETIDKVKKTARELGYRKPEKKSYPASDTLRSTIIVFAPSLANGYFSRLIHSITEHAGHYNYRVMTAVTFRNGESEQSFLDQYKEALPAGIIMLYPPVQHALLNSLAKRIPVVSIGEKPSGSRYDSVELNGNKTGYMMGEYLISQGHTHICYVSPPVNEKNPGRIRRYQGLADALENHGLNPSKKIFGRSARLDSDTDSGQSSGYDSSLTLAASRPLAYSRYSPDEAEYQNGYDLTLQLLEMKEKKAGAKFTAFVGHNDMTALGIMAAIRDKGFRIPQDCSVAGFDNIVLSAMPQISLTTIEHSSVQKGREAVDLICKKNSLKAKEAGQNYIMRMEYEPELIIRNTVKRL